MERADDELRVLLVSPLPPPPGGIATWTRILIAEARTRGDLRLRHVDSAVRWRRPGDLWPWRRAAGGAIQAARDLARVAWALATARPHVLHLTSSAGWAGPRDVGMLLLARAFGARGVLHYRTLRVAWGKRGLARAERIAMRLAARVVLVDAETRARLEPMLSGCAPVAIPNMVDLGAIDGWRARSGFGGSGASLGSRVSLAFVGLLVPEKGVFEQVEACAGLKEVDLHLVGPVEAAFRAEVERRARVREDGRWLTVHGPVPREEAWRRILEADAVLLPSHAGGEAFPNSLLEAMALSRPVVVSDVGAMPEMIDRDGDEPCGLCVEPGDAASLRAGIERLLARRKVWGSLGANGRGRVERLYATKPVLERLVGLWRELAEAGR